MITTATVGFETLRYGIHYIIYLFADCDWPVYDVNKNITINYENHEVVIYFKSVLIIISIIIRWLRSQVDLRKVIINKIVIVH